MKGKLFILIIKLERGYTYYGNDDEFSRIFTNRKTKEEEKVKAQCFTRHT